MSPRRSESVRRIAAIEAVVCRDVGRKTQQLIDANAGGLGAAAQSLAGATAVGLITGFFVPRGDVAAPETDGPVGTALLAAALAACGVPARIAVDTPCAGAVRAAVARSRRRRRGRRGRRRRSRRHRPPDRGVARRCRHACHRHRALRPQRRRPAAQHARGRRLALDGAARRSVPGRSLGRSWRWATAATRSAWAGCPPA